MESRAYVSVFAICMNKHIRVKPFACEESLMQSDGWTAHERIRTGVKCFTMCDTCRKSFAISSYAHVCETFHA